MLRLSSVPGNFAPRLLWLRWALCLAKVQLALWLVSFTCAGASADVGVVLNESLDEDVDRISSTGHSAIYFSRICPESPVRLRLCGPGEHGSVMSNYLNIGEDQQFEMEHRAAQYLPLWSRRPRQSSSLRFVQNQASAGRTLPGKISEAILCRYPLHDEQKSRMARNGGGYPDPGRLHFCGRHDHRAGPATHRRIQSLGEQEPFQRSHA